jgi:pyruvate dehydrogenase E2 component (dihydrolipoamide acetyltransferase)
MPAPAAGVNTVMLVEWAVEEAGEFAPADVLATIETDKAMIEIEAEAAGVLHRQLVGAGQEVEVGTPIAVIGSAGDPAEEIAAVASRATDGAGSPPGAGSLQDDRSSSGSGTTGSESGAHSGPTVDRPRATDPAPTTPTRIFASPIARRMARDAGLDVADLTGTGPGGRIVRRDVEVATAARDRPGHAPASTAPLSAATAAGSGSLQRGHTDHPHSRMRAAIARRISESKQTVPHFYLRATPPVDDLLALRAELNAGGGTKISINDLVVRAVARAHRAVPEMNVVFTDTAIRSFEQVDVAVAIAVDGGLLTPVIRDADRLSITEIAGATRDAADRARAGRLLASDLQGGTITVTNLGMFGVEEFTAIINPPQSAILAVGATRREPVVAGDRLAVASVMHLALSVDHRPIDGVVAARWLAALVELLTHPVRILA